MPLMKNKMLLISCSLLILCFATASAMFTRIDTPAAAAQMEDGQTIQTLLSEVHQLRLVLQRGNLNTYRAQIAVERMRLQQDQVLAIRRELEATRTQLLNAKHFHGEMEDRLKDMANQVNLEPDANRRLMLEREYREAKRNFDTQTQWETDIREKETQLTSQQMLEQSKLTDLGDRLEALERELQTQQPGRP
jgi:hypothetical protein